MARFSIIGAKTNMMMFSSLCVLFGGCITPFDFIADSKAPTIVITGQISTLDKRSFVSLGKTAETQRLPNPIEGASVMLISGGNVSSFYTETKPGEYWLNNFSGKSDSTYHIKVVLPNGDVYQSSPEKMPSEQAQVITNYEIVNEETVDLEGIVAQRPYFKIFANSIIPTNTEKNIFFKWYVEEVFAIIPTDCGGFGPPKLTCFILQNADPQRISLFTNFNNSKLSIENNLVANRLIDYSFLNKHSFTVYQSSITKEAHTYWTKVNILANQVGSIFDTPPAEVKGNCFSVNRKDEKVAGYFQVVNESFDRFSIFQSDLPFQLLYSSCICDNRSSFGGTYPARCSGCIQERNSSYSRPSWF
jgi:Domain of unknown function (DUF4249)